MSEAAVPPTVPLYGWYSAGRGDYFTTSDAAWAGTPGAVKSGYAFPAGRGRRVPTSAPRPPDTRPLYLWYSATRGDNFTTSDPRWAGTPGAVQSGYAFVSVQGYVHSSGLAGTIPLRSSYKGSVEDNRATSNPIATPAGYSFYRTEGYLTPPADDQPQLTPGIFGYEKAKFVGNVPLLVILYKSPPNTSFAANRPKAHFDDLIFGGPQNLQPNLKSWFASNSSGKLNVTKAGITDPVPLDATGLTGPQWRAKLIKQTSEQGYFNFAPYDRNADGTVSRNELLILAVGNTSFVWGQTDGTSPERICPSNTTVCVQPSQVAAAPQHSILANFVHELVHVLGGVDLYGSYCNNQGLTLMACTTNGNPRHIDGCPAPNLAPRSLAQDVLRVDQASHRHHRRPWRLRWVLTAERDEQRRPAPTSGRRPDEPEPRVPDRVPEPDGGRGEHDRCIGPGSRGRDLVRRPRQRCDQIPAGGDRPRR